MSGTYYAVRYQQAINGVLTGVWDDTENSENFFDMEYDNNGQPVSGAISRSSNYVSVVVNGERYFRLKNF